MANSKVQYTADGSTQTFAVTFPFISRTHVTVTVDGSSDTFTWNNDSQIVVGTTLSGGELVLIKRTTSQATRLVDYTDGSNLTENDMDLDSKQAFYMAQEALDELTLFDDDTVATTAGHILVADGTDFVNVAVSGDITLSSAGVAAIASDVIVNADINSSAAIAYSKLNLTGAILSADLAGSIDATKIADGTVSDTEFQYINSVTSNVQTQLDNITAGTISFPGLSSATAAVGDSIAIGDADDSEATKKDTIDDILGLYDSKTSTLTNKTFDANGTGNSLSNIDVADLANGTDGELITWGADAVATTVSAGSSGQVLTSNGAGSAPTFQASSGATNGFAIAMAVAL